MQHFFVPSDFSEAGDNALAYAAELAKQFRAKLTVVHVENTPPGGSVQALDDCVERLWAEGLTGSDRNVLGSAHKMPHESRLWPQY